MAKHKAFKKHKRKKHEKKKTEHKEKVHKEEYTTNIWRFSTFVLAVLLIGTIAYMMSTRTEKTVEGSSISEVAQKTVDYINSDILRGQAEAKLLEYNTTDYPGLYYIKISINGQIFESYVTSDGKLLFPSGIKVVESNETETKPTEEKKTSFDAPDAETPTVKLFVMAFCPFGLQAEKAMIPVYNLLKDKANFELHYVIYSNYGNECLANGTYCSMHGGAELDEDIRQLCIAELYGKDKLWEYLDQFDHECTYDNKETCWETAAENVGLNTTLIENCLQEEKDAQGETRIKREKEVGDQYGVRGSPTLFINDQEYSGARSPEAFKQAVCSGFTNPPEECNQTLSEEATSPGFGGGTSSNSGGQC